MVTLTFLFIAWLIRKRFVPEGTSRGDKVLYYLFSVTMTPLFGPWFFKVLIESKHTSHKDPCGGVYPYVWN